MSTTPPAPEAQTPHQPTPGEHILQLATGYIASISIYIAANLGIADLLAGGPKPVSDLAAATGSHEDRLYRVLRALASVGVFAEVAPRQFALTPAGAALRTGTQDSIHPMALWISDPFHFRVYAELLHTVKTGEITFDHIYGKPVFEYMPQNREESDVFEHAMTWFSNWVVPTVLEAYDFSGVETLLDVAGGRGALIRGILKKYPQMKGMAVDLEHVIEAAKQYPENKALGDRCRFQPADFFAAVPNDADAIIMKSIIHDWDDEPAVKILKNCRKALAGKTNAKVLLVEAVLTPGNDPHLGKLLDLEMMAMPGGRERTEQEFRKLLAAAGWSLTRVVPTKSPLCVVEGVPA
ncbi:MAG TPA: methyltransferase [Candidatus Angelobacter sp.]